MEKERKTFSFGLRTQLMLFTTVLAFITYSTSIIFYLRDIRLFSKLCKSNSI